LIRFYNSSVSGVDINCPSALDFDITIDNTAIEDTAPFPNPKIIDLIVGIWHCPGEHLISVKTLLLAPSFFLFPSASCLKT
jgi:hypothetical protein